MSPAGAGRFAMIAFLSTISLQLERNEDPKCPTFYPRETLPSYALTPWENENLQVVAQDVAVY